MKISLKDYITESLELALREEDKEKLLTLDMEYNDLYAEYRKCNIEPIKIVHNADVEYDKFMVSRSRGIKYFPKIEHDPITTPKDFVGRANGLIEKFRNFDCPISHLYIMMLEKIRDISNGHQDMTNPISRKVIADRLMVIPTEEQFQSALKALKDNPYKPVKSSQRTINAEQAKKFMQDHIDKLGYSWEVELQPGMMPRMSVSADGKMYVKPDAMFSDDDIEGLKLHEIQCHVGRRYYGLKTGLYLFRYGVGVYGMFDEGLAVWNSLHLTNKPKPNVYPNIAIKTVIAYQSDKMDFCDLFDYLCKVAPGMPEKKIYKNLIRFYRDFEDTELGLTCNDDLWYWCGLQLVEKMNDEQRDDILKYNIGPDLMDELPKIKKFLKLNKFEPLI